MYTCIGAITWQKHISSSRIIIGDRTTSRFTLMSHFASGDGKNIKTITWVYTHISAQCAVNNSYIAPIFRDMRAHIRHFTHTKYGMCNCFQFYATLMCVNNKKSVKPHNTIFRGKIHLKLITTTLLLCHITIQFPAREAGENAIRQYQISSNTYHTFCSTGA